MLEAFGLTDQGCVRANNEDYFILDTQSGIFVLADGMGGARGGEFASQLSAERLYEALLDQNELVERGAAGIDGTELEEAFGQANDAVLSAARSDPDLHGMGTTLVAVRCRKDQPVEVASVGDSRAYLLAEGGQLLQITRDQTWVTEVGSRLGLDEQAMRRHPMRHVLTMAIGTSEQLRIQIHRFSWEKGDQILLCSDGLHGVLPAEILRETLISEKNLREKCHYLVDAAKNAGGPDNITVVLIRAT